MGRAKKKQQRDKFKTEKLREKGNERRVKKESLSEKDKQD